MCSGAALLEPRLEICSLRVCHAVRQRVMEILTWQDKSKKGIAIVQSTLCASCPCCSQPSTEPLDAPFPTG